MDKKKKRDATFCILSIIGLLALFCLMVWFGFFKNSEPPKDVAASSSISEEQIEENVATEKEAKEEVRYTPGEFVLLESKEPTLQGKLGYFKEKYCGEYTYQQAKDLADEIATEENKVEGLKTFVGNQVYQTAPISDTIGPNYYQLCGYTINMVDKDGYVRNFMGLREEGTAKKIYVLESQSEVNDFKDQWEKGQAVLNGETMAEKGSIIVNGRLLPYTQFIEQNGEYYVPLLDVGKAADPAGFRYDPASLIAYIQIERASGFNVLEVPYGIGHGLTFTAGNESDEIGDQWTEEFSVGQGLQCYVPVSELSRYTGWYIYFDGQALSIVTDEMDVTDLFVLNTQGNRSTEAQLSDGDTVTKYY